MAEWAGIVLAGGASSRMGQDKALLTLDGITLLDRAIELLKTFGADPVVVSGQRPDHDAVSDLDPGRGPLGGLSSVLSACPELSRKWLIVVPVDMPAMTSASLTTLAAAAREQARGAIFDRSPLPMVLAPGGKALEAARAILAGDGRHSLRRLADHLDLLRVPAGQNDRLDNINRPEEFRDLCN